MANLIDEEDGLTESDRISNSIQNGHNVDPNKGVTQESFLAQYGSGNDAVQPMDEQRFLQQYGGPSAVTQGGMTANDFLAMYGSPADAPAPQTDPKDDADALAAKSQFIMEEADEDSDTYRDAKAMKEWLGANKEKFNSFSPDRKARISEGINMDYDAAEKQRGHARVFWDAVQRGFWGTGRMIYQGWEALTGGGSKESEDNIRASVREGELDDILNPQRIGSTSNIHNVGDALDWFSESIGENAVRGAVATGAAMAGAAAAPVVLPGVAWAGTAGAIAFGTAGTMAMNTGEAVQDQLAEEDLSGGKQKYSRGYAALQGLGYSLLDGAFGASAWAGKLWGNVLSKMGRSTAGGVMRETATRAGLGSAAKELVVHGMLGEGAQEVAQSQLVGRGRRLLQSGSMLKTGEDVSDAFLEAWDEFAGGAAAGLGMGGPAAIHGHVTAKNQYQKYTGVQDLDAYGEAFKNIGPEIEKVRQTLASDGAFGKFANFFRDNGADGRYAQMLIARHVINDHIKNSNVVDTELAESCNKSNEIIDKEIEDLRNSNNETDRAIGDLTRSYIDIFNTTNAKENFDSTVGEAQRNGMRSQFGTAGVEESVEANDDGSRDIYGKDAATGISVVNKVDADGNSSGWTVVNNPNFKQPVLGDDQLVFNTQEEAVEMAKKVDLFNQARVVKNDNKVKTIRSVFNKLYGARGAKLEIVDRDAAMPEGTTAAAVISPEDGSVTVKVNVDGINSVGELYNALVHERSHEDIAELIIQSNKLIGPDGRFVNDGYKRFNEIRDRLMQNVVGADEMLARAQAVAEKEGKENTWTQRSDQDKNLGRTNKGYVGEELLAERQAVNDTVAALMRGNQGLIGTLTERIQSAIKGRMAADMGLSPQAIMPSDVAKVVGVAFERGYAGIRPKAAESANPAEAKPADANAEKPTGTATVSNPVDARQPMKNGDGQPFAPGSIIKRNSDNTVFTRTEDGKWRNDAGTEIETVDDATASEGGYTIISEPAAKDVVTADAEGGVTLTGKPSDAEAKTEEKPVEKPVETAEAKDDTASVAENTPETTVEASEDVKTDNVPSESPKAPEAVSAVPETKTEEKSVEEERTPVAETPKKEESSTVKTAKKSKRKPANKKKGNLGLTETAAEKKEEKKEAPVESDTAKTETASEPEVKEEVPTVIAPRSEQKAETKPDPKPEPKPEKNPVKKAEEPKTEEAKDNSTLRISEQLKFEIGKAEKKSGLKVTDEQKQAAQRFLAENGGKVGFISKKDNVFKGALVLDSEKAGCCVLVSKDGRIFFGLDEYAAAVSKSSENESSETKSEGSKSFQQVLRGLMAMPAGMPLQEHVVGHPSVKGLTDNAVLRKAAQGDEKFKSAFFDIAFRKLIVALKREGVSDEEIVNRSKDTDTRKNFRNKISNALNAAYAENFVIGRQRKIIKDAAEKLKNALKNANGDELNAARAEFARVVTPLSDMAWYPEGEVTVYGGPDKAWLDSFYKERERLTKLRNKVADKINGLTSLRNKVADKINGLTSSTDIRNYVDEFSADVDNVEGPLGVEIPSDSLLARIVNGIVDAYKNNLPAVEKSLEYIAKRNEIYDALGDETETDDDTSNEIPLEYKSMSGVELVKKAVEDLDLHARNEIILRYCYDNDNLRKFIYRRGVKDDNTVGDIIASVHEDLVRSFDYEKEDWLNSANKKNPEKSIANMATGKALMRVYAERRRMSRELLTSFAEFSAKSMLFGDFSEKKKGRRNKNSKEQYSDPKAKELAGTIEFLKKELRTKDFSGEEKADIRKKIREAENELNELLVGKADELNYGTSRVAKGGEGVGYKYLLRSNKEDQERIRLLADRLGTLLKMMSNRNYTVMKSMMEAFVEKCDGIQESIFAYQNDRLTAKQAEALNIEYVRTHHGVEEKIKKLREADIFDEDVVAKAAEKAGMYKGLYLANLRMIVADVRALQDVKDESSVGGRIALAGLMNNGNLDYSANDVIAALKTNKKPYAAVELAEKGLSDEEIAKKVRGESLANVTMALDNAERDYGWVDPRVGTSEKSRADFVRGIEAFFRKAGYADSYGETERWLKENGYAANIEENEMLAPYRNRRQKALFVDRLVLNMSLDDGNYETPVFEWLRSHGFTDRDAKEFVEAYKRMDEDAKVLREHGAFSRGKDLLGAYHRSVLRELKKAEKSREGRDATADRIRLNAAIDGIVAGAGAGVNPESVIRTELSNLGFAEDEIATALANWNDKELREYAKEERRLAKEADAQRKAKLEEARIKGEMVRESKEADVKKALSTEAMFDEANRLAHEALADGLSEKDAHKKVSAAFSLGGMDLDKAGEYADKAISIAATERARMTTEARDAEKAAQDKAYLDSLSEEERKKVLAERAAEAAKIRKASDKFHAERKEKIGAENEARTEKNNRINAYEKLKNDKQAKDAYDQFEKAKVEAKIKGLTPMAYLKKELGATDAAAIKSAHDIYQKRVLDYEKSKEFNADNAVASASQPGLFKSSVTTAEDAAYMDAVKRGDMETAQRMVNERADESLAEFNRLNSDDDEVGFKYHRGPSPKRTKTMYAVFNVNPDGFRAAYAGNANATPVGVWLDAQNLKAYTSSNSFDDAGNPLSYIPGDTGASWKAKGLNQSELDADGVRGKGFLLQRGGKHGSSVPNFAQMNTKMNEAGEKVSSTAIGALPHNKLIFEIEVGMDENGDLTDFVKKNGRMVAGKNQGLDKIGPNQFYTFKTNPNANGEWGIAGTFRIKRLVPHDEVVAKTDEANDTIRKHNANLGKGERAIREIPLQKWVGGYRPEDSGISVESVDRMYQEGLKKKLLDPVTYDDVGNVIPLSERFNPEKEDIRYSQPGIFKDGEEKKDAEYFTADDTRFSAAAEASRAAHGGTVTSKSLKLNSTDADLIRKADRLVNDKVAMENILAMALHDKPLTPDQALALSKGSAKLRGTLMALEEDQTSDHGESIRQFRDTLDKYDEAMARTGYIYGAGLRSFRIGFDISNADEHMAYLVRDLESSMKGAGLNMRKVEDPGICVDPKEKANYERIKKEYGEAKAEIREYAEKVAKLSKELEAEHNARLAAEQRTVNANASAEMERIKDEAYESGRASGLAEAARPIALSKDERAKLNAKYGREISDTALQAKKFIMNLLGKSVSYAGKGGGAGISSDQDIAFKAIVDQFDGDFDEAIKFFDGDKDAERMFRQWQAGLQSEVEAESDRTEKVDATVPKKERRKRATKKIVSSGSSIFKKKVEAEQKKAKTAAEKYEKKLDHLTKMLYEVLENGTPEFKATLGEFARTWAHAYFLNRPEATRDEVLESVRKQMGYQDRTLNYTIEDAKKAISGDDGYRYRTKASVSVTKAKLYKARKALEEGRGLRDVAKELGIDYTTDAEIVDAVVESLEKMQKAQVDSIDKAIDDKKSYDEIGKNVRRITEAIHKIKTSNDSLEAVQEFVELAGLAKKYRKDMTEAERLKAQLDEWERRIDEEDFETHSRKRVEPKNPAENKTIRRLQMEIRLAQKNFANAKRHHQWKKMGVLGKSWTDTLDLLSMVKGIAGSLDFSSFLRQGGQMTWAHPIMAVKSFRKMLGVIKNQKMADDAMIDIMCRDTFPLMERAGIEWTDYGSGKVNYDERFIPLRGYAWFTKLKPVSGAVALSERAFAMYLNIMRANMFDYLVAHAQKKFTDKGVEGWTDEELKKIGNMINVASQRAAIGKDDAILKKSIEAANYVLWSPRNFISRIQFLKESGKLLLSYVPKLGKNVNVYGKGSGNESSEKIVRDLIAQELVRYVAGVSGAILFTKMFADLIRGDDEPPEDMVLDPRSSDFLKIKFGNTRVDYLSGLQQIMVFSWRFWTGEKTNLRGQTHKLNSRYDLTGRFLRSKFSPLGGMVWDWASGETFDRQDITWDPRKALVNNKEEISGYRYLVESTMTPLTGRDLVEQLKYTGIGPTIGTFMLTMIGAGVQAFDPYSYKQLKEDFRYFKRLRDGTNDPVERKRIEEYHPMLKRAGSIDAQIKNIQRIEKDIRNIEKNGGKPGDWMLDNLERERKRAINLMAGFRNPFDTGE